MTPSAPAREPTPADVSASPLYRRWLRLSRWPGGRRLFGWLVGRMAPYTSTIGPRIEALAPGYARASMRDRRRVRNHLRSVHAIALMNLGEMTTGLAMMAGLPPSARSIITRLEIDFERKARGRITAECRTAVPEAAERREVEMAAELRDPSGQMVARVRARWLVGPRG